MKDNSYSFPKSNKAKIEERQKYIIHQKLAFGYKILQVFATILCWCAILYCYRDIFIDIYHYITGKSDVINFPKEIFENIMAYAIVTFFIITIWIFYNKWMFGGHDRRRGFPIPRDEKQAEQYGISVEQLQMMRSSRLIDVGFDGENKIKDIIEQKL